MREWGEGSVSDLFAWEQERSYFQAGFAVYVQMLHGMGAFIYCELLWLIKKRMTIAWLFLKKLKIELPRDPEILSLYADCKGLRSGSQVYLWFFFTSNY
jgi:hypothetical protein